MKNPLTQQTALYLLTFTASIAVSLYVYAEGDIVNKDALLYFSVAQRFLDGGLAEAYATYNWPFFGLLLAGIHQATELSYEDSARILNSFLAAITCTTFVAIYKEVCDEKARPWIAALLILSLPVLNGYRDLLIRDFGFWAFSLAGLLYFIRFTRDNSLSTSLIWQLAIIIAIAFRIEGIVFAAAPTLYYFTVSSSSSGKLKSIAKSSSIFFSLGAIGLAGMASYGLISLGGESPTLRLWLSYFSPMSMINEFRNTSSQIHQQLGLLSSTEEVTLVLSIGLIAFAILKIANNAVIPYLLTMAYGSRNHWVQINKRDKVVILFFMLSMLPLTAFLANNFFLSSRHTVLTALFLSLLSFQYVDIAFQKLAAMRKQRWAAAGGTIIAILFFDGIVSTGSSKAIIKTSSSWALKNIDQSEPWLCNEVRLSYYTEGKCQYVKPAFLLPSLREPSFDPKPGYLLMWIGRNDKNTASSLEGNTHIQLVNKNENSKGDRVAVFKTSSLPRL